MDEWLFAIISPYNCKNCLNTFGSGLDVVSEDGALARVAVDPAEADGGQGLGEDEVPRSAGRAGLRARGHVADGGRAVVDGLGPHTEGVGHPLLQVVDVHEVLGDPLLHLFGVV